LQAYSLPARAKMVSANINGKVKIGITVGRADSCAVEARTDGRLRCGIEIRVVFHEIDQRLTGIRLSKRVLIFVGLH